MHWYAIFSQLDPLSTGYTLAIHFTNSIAFLSKLPSDAVNFWNSAGNGPISDFVINTGHGIIHISRTVGHGIIHVACKGRNLEMPATSNSADITKACK